MPVDRCRHVVMPRGDIFAKLSARRARTRDAGFGVCATCGARIDLSLAACPICSHATSADNPNRTRIVGADGQDALARCPSCVANVAADDAYCRSCGYDLTRHALSLPLASAQKPATLVPVRRFVMGGAVLMITGAVLLGLAVVMPGWINAQPAAPPESGARAALPGIKLLAPTALPAMPTLAIPATETPLPAPTLLVSTIPVIDSPGTPIAQPEPKSPPAAPLATPTQSGAVAPTAAQVPAVPGVVRATQDKVVVRPEPALGAQSGFVLNGATVDVLCVIQGGTVPGQVSAQWYRVRLPDGLLGFIWEPVVDVAGAAVPECSR
jgi:hypothetical protein